MAATRAEGWAEQLVDEAVLNEPLRALSELLAEMEKHIHVDAAAAAARLRRAVGLVMQRAARVPLSRCAPHNVCFTFFYQHTLNTSHHTRRRR
jgi:hypothetical protein